MKTLYLKPNFIVCEPGGGVVIALALLTIHVREHI